MTYSVKKIAEQIKSAREKKGLSQRALGDKIGVPQSHISRIESGEVNFQTSSLIELSRALDLELMLVPRPLVPSFQGIQRRAEAKKRLPLRAISMPTAKSLDKVQKAMQKFSHAMPQIETFRTMLSALNKVAQIPISGVQVEQVKKEIQKLQPIIESMQEAQNAFSRLAGNKDLAEKLNQIGETARYFNQMQSGFWEGASEGVANDLPAYRLDEEDADG